MLQKIETYKQSNNPHELANTVSKKSNEMHKEGDKIRKQFNKGELTSE